MRTYREYLESGGPSGIDGPSNTDYDRDIDGLLVFLSQTRDSDDLEQSNFASALALLGGESETVKVHRFGHWACGWIESILIDPEDTDTAEVAQSILAQLADYPVLDDDDYSRREWESFERAWKGYGQVDYIKAICKSVYLPSDEEQDRLTEALEAADLKQWHLDTADCPYETDAGGVYIPTPDSFTWDEIASMVPEYIDGLKQYALAMVAQGKLDLFGDAMRWRWDDKVDFDPEAVFDLIEDA